MLLLIITLCILSILLPIILKTENIVTESNDKIVFEFNKKIKITMLICTIFFVIISLIVIISSIMNKEKGTLFGIIIFSLFALLSSFLYLLMKNKKIIYSNNILYSFNVFGKKSIFNIEDIESATEKTSDGLIILFKNGKKIKFDIQMNNYGKIKDILEKNSIVYKDQCGNNSPKGW